jgi:hypothetical protein
VCCGCVGCGCCWVSLIWVGFRGFRVGSWWRCGADVRVMSGARSQALSGRVLGDCERRCGRRRCWPAKKKLAMVEMGWSGVGRPIATLDFQVDYLAPGEWLRGGNGVVVRPPLRGSQVIGL